MTIVEILKIIVGVLSMLFGVIGVARPKAMADFAHFGLADARGVAETRINFGGFFIALGGGVILLNDPEVYILLGLGYAGLAIVRLINAAFERSLLEPVYLATLGFEIVSAIILLLPTS